MDVARIGITGPNGRLGSELVRRGCVPLECDVTVPTDIQAALVGAMPDVVIHCAAFTNVDACEDRLVTSVEVNTDGTYHLSQMFDGPIMYLSTDYIFDGLDGPYDESAKLNPLNMYGWSKLGGEIVIRSRENADDLIVRTTILFDRWPNNFVTTVANMLLRGDPMALPDMMYGTPTYIPDLADGILAAIEVGASGTVNLAGSLLASRHQIGLWIADELKIDRAQVRPRFVGSRAKRPMRAGLKTDMARSMGLPIRDPMIGIREVCQHALETMAAR